MIYSLYLLREAKNYQFPLAFFNNKKEPPITITQFVKNLIEKTIIESLVVRYKNI